VIDYVGGEMPPTECHGQNRPPFGTISFGPVAIWFDQNDAEDGAQYGRVGQSPLWADRWII